MDTDNKEQNILLTALATLGIVYGDIGTSPLYAVNLIFFGPGGVIITPENVLGSISLIFWTLTIMISIKYVFFVLRADNRGEGGIFALFGLLTQKKTELFLMTTGLIFAAGLLFGDGIITPAISVLSAIEGLEVATKFFSPYVVPITISILTLLFYYQHKGTTKIGQMFGPIMLVWFISIGAFGLYEIVKFPKILHALNPLYSLKMLATLSFKVDMEILGAVVLVMTGGEALYADMGHFGVKPIRLSWYSFVYPTLLLNYFGQGAYLLSGGNILDKNIFFSLIPDTLLYPMIILATLATIIASQALITGAFALASQAMALGLLPLLRTKHTSVQNETQIYIPFVNWTLYLGCIMLVIVFQSSNNLGSAYGLAVSGVMLFTSLAAHEVALRIWNWRRLSLLFFAFGVIDAAFLFANSLKFIEGGYVPIFIGIGLFLVMDTWRWGKKIIASAYAKYPENVRMASLIEIKNKVFVNKIYTEATGIKITEQDRPVIIMISKPVTQSSDYIPK